MIAIMAHEGIKESGVNIVAIRKGGEFLLPFEGQEILRPAGNFLNQTTFLTVQVHEQ